jgi:hypothetical protein
MAQTPVRRELAGYSKNAGMATWFPRLFLGGREIRSNRRTGSGLTVIVEASNQCFNLTNIIAMRK